MSTIKLNSLHCEKLQDSISEDEIEVRINGLKVAGPFGVHKDETVQLGGISRSFTGTVNVQLVEKDANSATDSLGTRTVGSHPVTGNTLVFDALKHAYYTVNYTVS
ncbi:hypothetical protein Asp14428_65240 [Actinoplanes sp. NBRC 14428]|uniref:Uncharacterized protein n=1 Tax=Pseudosporangium ferrugineum TaxID=439699 RepID=A0A2T0RNZ3_9ACTN|nr:hypothetical protein [Pseudosporangium ferrugineum]PRY22914.1 hypothetical protein CLV70_116177 [Pseudosporangium ferrugineum]BCJ55049.1 hypothetical protein Asp14428_65240 [Actinoplanes sp. NBRC 14428]